MEVQWTALHTLLTWIKSQQNNFNVQNYPLLMLSSLVHSLLSIKLIPPFLNISLQLLTKPPTHFWGTEVPSTWANANNRSYVCLLHEANFSIRCFITLTVTVLSLEQSPP